MSAAVLAGAGLSCAVGLSVAEAAAAVRAGMMRFEAGPLYGPGFEPFTLAQLPDAALPGWSAAIEATAGLTSRELRLLRLAPGALAECTAPLGDAAARVPLLLALPERETPIPMHPERLLALLATQAPGTFDPSRSAAAWRGRAGGLIALGTAVELVRTGQAAQVLVGGVDTFRDAWLLAALHAEGRVKSSQNLDGFVPGEGAVFLLVTTPEAAPAPPWAQLSALSHGEEPGHLGSAAPYLGEGLAGVVGPLVAHLRLPTPFPTVWSTMNGESHWGKEWGVTYLRHRAAFTVDHAVEHPADCVGDLGAAAGLLGVALAAHGLREGYRPGPALCYASNDGAARAALAVLPA
jgi:3-oxoacyl-[acyl-carrier-protein] synthase-1